MNHPRRARLRLLLCPLLLLVLLGALKWRADHPPLSQMDRDFQAALRHPSLVTIGGSGGEWAEWTEADMDISLQTHDKGICSALAQTLRCSEDEVDAESRGVTTELSIDVDVRDAKTNIRTLFVYQRGKKGAFIDYYKQNLKLNQNLTRNLRVRRAAVRGRFIPEFEALIAQLVQRAESPDKHPEITWVVEH